MAAAAAAKKAEAGIPSILCADSVVEEAHKKRADASGIGVAALAAAAAQKIAEGMTHASRTNGMAVGELGSGVRADSNGDISITGRKDTGVLVSVSRASQDSLVRPLLSRGTTNDNKSNVEISPADLRVARLDSEMEERDQPFSSMYKLQPTRNNQAEWVAAVKEAVQGSAAMPAHARDDGAAADEDFFVQAPPTPIRYTQADWLAAIDFTIKKVKKKPKTLK